MSPLSRRSVLRRSASLLLGCGAVCVAERATAHSGLIDASMIVAGPANAPAGLWAERLAGPLAQALHPGTALTIAAVGGRDGVTGANAFEALTDPDGSTALLVPGAAAMAWLAGDPRVHFDAGRWVPALTSFGSAVLILRTTPGSRSREPRTLRVAASTPTGVELSALLGLSLLGWNAVPVFGLSDARDARAALLDRRVDAVLLTGRDVPARGNALCAADANGGLRPLFSLGSDSGPQIRDAGLADVPTLPELYREAFGRAPSGTLFEAWKATAAGARLDAALVLQPLTPAALVAQWRRACGTAVADPALTSAARVAELTPLPAPGCVAALSTIVIGENTLLALRRWIASRSDWRPA